MAKPDLYICHTAYHVMVDMLRAMRSKNPSMLVMAAVIPNAQELRRRLEFCKIFDEVRIFDETMCNPVNYTNPILFALRQHRAEKKEVESTDFSIYPPRYNKIYIHNDWSLLGRYLQDIKAHYILCEDTFASTLWPEHPLIENQRRSKHFERWKRTGQGYLFWGDYKGVDAVETEDITRCQIHKDKLIQNSKGALLHGLSDLEKITVRKVFMTEKLPEKAENATILMTHSFVQDGTMSQEKQNAIWLAVMAKYRLDGPLFIKAHPRDIFNYKTLFPDAIVLERGMPSEVLNFALPFRFARAITVQSTVLSSFEAADEKIDLSLADAEALLDQYTQKETR